MHAVKLLHKQLLAACPAIHVKRLQTLIDATEALSQDQQLSITGIGRALRNHTTAKHNIKRIDRLVGNTWLFSERLMIYQAMTSWLLGGQQTPVILIDWSDLSADRQQQLLRASIPTRGRSLTIYEEVHPQKRYAHPTVHRQFLNRLQQLLPDGVTPIVVTDAGFRGTWFRLVNQHNWHWVGRVRNREFIQLQRTSDWVPCKALYAKASQTSKVLGAALLTRSQPNEVMLYLLKKPKAGRVTNTLSGQRTCNSRHQKIAEREREPWLLAASPSLQHLTAKQVVAIYQKRMQIEEGFRDIKCERYGLGLSTSLTKAPERLAILLLLGVLALLVLWVVGSAAIQAKQHYQYQSNTTKQRRVLSVIFIGMLVLRRTPNVFKKELLLNAMVSLRASVGYDK